MLPQEIIRIKRDGGHLNDVKIQRFIQGVTSGTVTEGQIAAFCMAVFFRGMALDERVALTLAMTRSGTVLDWKPLNLPGPILDKHSTGGVGDKVSLILAPAIAACGGFVPMISGRGLGHAGGTLDKLDSIPGYVSLPDRAMLERVIRDVGCAIIGATDAFAPADKRVYAVRDITATVESIDLITASILSKKLAAGLDALVMDVKFGSGAFMAAFDDAVDLAESIVTVATGAGMPTVALLTDMNEALGRTAGNALEVRESIDFLTGAGHDPRLYEVTAALSAELLVLGGLAPDMATARARFDEAISSGAAAERFGRMITALGGPADLLENPGKHLATAPVQREVHASRSGFITAIDTRALGIGVVALGGGRSRVQDPIDPAVGLSDISGLGAAVGDGGRPLAVVHARNEDAAEAAADAIRSAFTIGDSAPSPTPPVARRLAR
jgi:thymidine phosphorylase